MRKRKDKLEVQIEKICNNCENKGGGECPVERIECFRLREVAEYFRLSELVYENSGAIVV